MTRRELTASGVAGAAWAAFPFTRVLAQEATPSQSGDFLVTVVHALGETTLPSRPRRIVSTDMNEAVDSLLAIALQPVYYALSGGYIDGIPEWVWDAGLDPAIPSDRIARFELDLERVVAMQPDLIVGTWLEERQYQQLSEIAPTIVVKAHDKTTWQETQRMIGLATGRDEEAVSAIAETDAVLAEQHARLEPFVDKTIAVAYEFFGEFLVNGENAPIGRVLRDFGFTVLSPGTAEEGDIDFLSLEQINVISEADIIVTPEFFADDLAKLEANALFRLLPAVQNGGYAPLSREDAQALYLESSLSFRWGIPRVADAVIEAANGSGRRLTS
jgi:iron complex transport system substrate-binding protein